MSIIEVASMCGFASTPPFSKCYRKHFGILLRDERVASNKAQQVALIPIPQAIALSPHGPLTSLYQARNESTFASYGALFQERPSTKSKESDLDSQCASTQFAVEDVIVLAVVDGAVDHVHARELRAYPSTGKAIPSVLMPLAAFQPPPPQILALASYNASSTDRSIVVVKRTFIGMVEAGKTLIQQALEAIREAHKAEASDLPEHEVKRLDLLVDSLYQAIIDFQFVKNGKSPSTIH